MGEDYQDLVLQEKLKAQKDFRRKLKKQKRRQRILIEEKNALLAKGEHYDSLQEEVEGLRKINSELQIQDEKNLGEIEDLSHEFEKEKEIMLANIRELEKECGFFLKVSECLIPTREMEKIRKISKFNDINNYWKVPPFSLQNKQVILPRIGKAQAMEMVANDIKDKYVVFTESSERGDPPKKLMPRSKGTMSNNLIRRPPPPLVPTMNVIKKNIKLEPLKKNPGNSGFEFNLSV